MARLAKRTIEVESKSRPGKTYQVKMWDDGSASCNCPSWIFSGKDRGCKHIDALGFGAKKAA